MPNIESAIKRVRTTERSNELNSGQKVQCVQQSNNLKAL